MREKSKTILVSKKHRFVFIHNYKVAGTSVRRALCRYEENFYWLYSNLLYFLRRDLRGCSRNCLEKHSSLKSVVKFYDPNDYSYFGLVRNPWDWEVSKYFYMIQTSKHWQHELVKGFSGFEEYLEWRMSECRLQLSFFSDERKLLTENIFKVEELYKFEEYLRDKFGISAKLGKSNASRRTDYRKYYDDNTKEVVCKMYKEDIDFFKYEF